MVFLRLQVEGQTTLSLEYEYKELPYFLSGAQAPSLPTVRNRTTKGHDNFPRERFLMRAAWLVN